MRNKLLLFLIPLVLWCSVASAASTATVCDNTTDCVLLLHADGVDASTTFTDTAKSKTVTANGNAQVDTAQSKFGGASILLDGSGDYLTIPDSTDWDFGTGDFTIDFWVRFNSVSPVEFIGINGDKVESWFDGSNLWFRIMGGASDVVTSWSPSANTWYHIALVRSGTTMATYIDGTQQGTNTNSSDIQISAPVYIGISSGLNRPLNGWLDEIRISKGTAVWTTNFTPPSAAYTLPTRRRMLQFS